MNKQQIIIAELANLNPPRKLFNQQAISSALAIFNNPQFSYRVIHLAGTNGKGSTAAFIESALVAAGYTVAKFTSPYIHCPSECIMLNQQAISIDELVECYLMAKEKLQQAQISLSSFEMLTLLMFIFAAKQQVDYLVLETGFGGLDDATNVVKADFCVITNISLEHTQYLGSSLAAIAKHKAGIIHANRTIIADNTPELIAAVAKRTNDYVNVLQLYDYSTKLNLRLWCTELFFSSAHTKAKQLNLGLFGHFQARNFLAAYQVLHEIGLSDELIFKAAGTTRWAGRLQLIQRYPPVLADASHNAAGALNLAQSLASVVNQAQSVVIVSILRDKDTKAMLDAYSKIAQTLVLCNLVAHTRASSVFSLAKYAKTKFQHVYALNAPVQALQFAKRLKPKLIVISGSTYLLKNFI